MYMILRVAEYFEGNWYGKSTQEDTGRPRGRKPNVSDEDLLAKIREVITGSRFHGEGYVKVHAILRRKCQVTASKERILRLMRDNDLLSPHRHVRTARESRKHDGVIITQGPDQMWGTDGKLFRTARDGWCWFFGVIDHFNDEILSFNVSRRGTRWEAMEPIRAAVKKRFGSLDRDVCKNLSLRLRSDHGTQYDSKDFMNEMAYLGLEMSKSFVREPQCNGCIERFNRTIEEEVFSIESFDTTEEAERAIKLFVEDYNNQWMIHRLGLRSPLEYRVEFEAELTSSVSC